jgi:hypothetical protein
MSEPEDPTFVAWCQKRGIDPYDLGLEAYDLRKTQQLCDEHLGELQSTLGANKSSSAINTTLVVGLVLAGLALGWLVGSRHEGSRYQFETLGPRVIIMDRQTGQIRTELAQWETP